MKVMHFFLLVSVLLVSVSFLSAQNVSTSVSIPNSAPQLVTLIPNWTWGQNQNLVNAFSLHDYFVDNNGDNMTFSVTNYSQILVVINQSTGYVSFYPTLSFIGTEIVTFYAADDQGNTSSNLVYLNVGTDTEAPRWFDLSNHSNVSQNDIVTFSVDWTDNVGLSSFTFSINQNGVWTNYSEDFSGTSNSSEYQITISGAPDSVIFWKFYAFDTSLNMNVTDTYNTTLASIPSTPAPASPSRTSSSSSSFGGGFTSFLQSVGLVSKPYDFIFDPTSLSVEALQGDTRSLFFNVVVTGTENLTFEASLNGLTDLVFLNNKEFSIDSGQSKEVLLELNVPRNHLPDQYFGTVRVTALENANLTKSFPIIVLVKEFDPLVDLNVVVDEGSSLVRPGDSVSFTVTASQENYEKDVEGTLYMAVKDVYGTVYDSKETQATVGALSSFSDSLFIAPESDEGQYIVYSRFEYENRSSLASDSFLVGYRFKFSSFLRISGTFFYIFLLALVFALLAYNYERKKKKERLLNLYLLLSQMKDKLRNNDLTGAADVYIRIKVLYGQKVPTDLVADKEFLKKELKRLSAVIESSPILRAQQEAQAKKEESGAQQESDSSKEDDSSKEGDSSKEEVTNDDATQAKGDETKTPVNPQDNAQKQESVQSSDQSSKPVTSSPQQKISVSPSQQKPTSPSPQQKPVSTSPQSSLQKKPVVKKVIKKIIRKVPAQNKNLKEPNT